MKIIKKIFKSRILRFLFSVVLIYFAFKKVDIKSLLGQLIGIKWWFLLSNILISLFTSFLISYRWSFLLIKKPRLKDALVFFKSTIMASFYALFVPSAVGTDMVKWLITDEKYPQIPKSKLLGSVFLDRFVGLSTYIFWGLIFVFVARIKGVYLPPFVFYLVLAMVVAFVFFYVLLYFLDLKKIISKWKFLEKFGHVAELVNKENLPQIFKGMLVSVFSELTWVMQNYFIAWYFGANVSIFSIMIFIPIISIILLLPISIAGFGAREQLFLFFFVPLGGRPEGLLLTSAFNGILGVINSLIGGVVTLIPGIKKIDKK